jgi:hypothetical protein
LHDAPWLGFLSNNFERMNASRFFVSRYRLAICAALAWLLVCNVTLFAAPPTDDSSVAADNASATTAGEVIPANEVSDSDGDSQFTAELTASQSTASQSTATPDCTHPRQGDDIWLISTRQLGCGVCLDRQPNLRYWHLEAGAWQAADLKEFLAADNPRLPTDFYIHGNQNTTEDANDHGFTIYHQLVAGAPKDMPIRFVIWSWPTDPGPHPLQLIRSHAYRSDTDAWYLGWLLSQMDRRVPIGLAGYSFGTRVATGAIHLMGGSELLGSALPLDPKAGVPKIHAVLIAAAEDDNWLAPGAPNAFCIPTVERMLLVNNSCDSALKHYPLMDRCTRASALGYVGLVTADPKIAQCDACCAVGEEHNWELYFCNECLVARMRPYLYLADLPPAAIGSEAAKPRAKPASIAKTASQAAR